MATGHTNTNKAIISKLNEVIASQETTNNKVTNIDTRITNMTNTVNTVNNSTSQLSTTINQIKSNTEQPKFRQYIPDTSMRYCGLHARYTSKPPISDSMGAMYNGELHVVTGQCHAKWNPQSGWVTLSEKSAYGYYWVSEACLVPYNGELHLLGGSSEETGTNHYKWNGSKWSSISTLPYHLYSGRAVVYNNELHIFGSYKYEYETKHYKWNGSTWSSVSTLPISFCNGSVVVYNDEIHMLGNGAVNSKGYHYSENSHYKWSYSIGWQREKDLPVDLCRGGAVVINGRIHIAGGNITDSDTDSKNYEIYAWDGNDWLRVGVSPFEFDDDIMIVNDGIIHMLGYAGSSNVHYQIRPLYRTTMYLKAGTTITGNQLSIKGINDISYLVKFGSSYKNQYDGIYDISASSGIMLS